MMRISKFLVLPIVFLVACISASHAQGPLVEVFYETLNDPVRKFFVEQFKVAADNLTDLIDLRLYPYGRTTKTGTTYTCEYGEYQCLANKIHVCLINAETPTPTTRVDHNSKKNDLVQSWVKSKSQFEVADPQNENPIASFVNCFFKNRFVLENIEDLAERCLPADPGADWAGIHSCYYNNPETDAITDAFGVKTAEVATEIQTDGLVVRIAGNVNNAAKTNFLGEICRTLGQQDGICVNTATPPSKVKLAVYYESFNTDVGNYLDKQLATYYHVLEDFVDIELVPYGNTQLIDATNGIYNCTSEDLCISNKFQALVVDAYINKPLNGDWISGENRAINFIRCIFKSTAGNAFKELESCSNQYLEIDEYRKYIEYVKDNTDEVRTVYESMRTKTLAVAPNGLQRVPLVTINGQVDYNAFDDLIQEACAQYTGPIRAGICTKAQVTVLYEPLNHKSRTFFLEQLNPVFNNLYNLIDLNMIPAGRAVHVPGQGPVCKGGSDQCDAMKLQACAIDYFWNDGNNYTDPIRQEVFDFIVCTFKNKRLYNVMDAAEFCSEGIELDAWFTIHGCFMEGLGTVLLEDNIELTHSIISNVDNHEIPVVLINNVEVTDLGHIKKAVCDLYDEYHAPDYCFSDLAPKVQVKVFYESMSELSKHFFTTQYDPWYIYIEEIAQIDLYPMGNVNETNTDGSCDDYNGTSPCLGNKFQAFVIDKYAKHDDDGDYIDGTLRAAHFIGCYFNQANYSTNAYEAAEHCTDETLPADEWFDVLTTVKSEEGNAIYKVVQDITNEFKATNNLQNFERVPWVTLNNQNHSKRAANDLLQTICSEYTGDKPLECTQVHVEVYYSAINPQSRRFFLDQLIPTFRNLRERINLELIPYGVVNYTQTIDEECETKEQICRANTAQACAISKYFGEEIIQDFVQWDGKNQTIAFIGCMFKNQRNQDIFELAEVCANQNIVLGDEISACLHQEEGKEILSQMRSRTMGQYEEMEHAPWVVINGLRSSLAQSDLKTAVCDNIVGDKPNYCYEPTPAKVKVEFHYSAGDVKSANYFSNELYPHYRLLEEIIDVEVVPFGLTDVRDEGNGNFTFICPKGLSECRANLIHACVYSEYFHADDGPISDNPNDQTEYDGKVQVIEYINCHFTNPNFPSKPLEAAEQCIEQIFGDVYSSINQCAHSSLGTQLLLEFQEKKVATLLPHLTYTPWLTLNGKHNYSLEHHIQRAVCGAYTGREKPLDCYQIYDTDEKPTVEIHYEPHDNRSQSFFGTSFLNGDIYQLANVVLIPFGRSTYDDTAQKCINNDNCDQYKEHACLLDLYYATHQQLTLQVISCTFGDQINDPNVVNTCVNQILEGVEDIVDPWREIETCVIDRGHQLLLQNSALVQGLSPNISHVPWVLINGEHDIEAELSLVNEICGAFYPADKPALCKPDLIPVAIYYETLNTDVSSFFLSQLSQYTEYLDEIGQFTFIPYGTTRSTTREFTCSKDKQCHGNLAHACILNRFYNRSSVNPDSEYEKNRIRIAGFLECTAFEEQVVGSTDPVHDAEVCLEREFEGDLWRDIHYCATGQEGADILTEMGRQTAALSPPLAAAPHITINSQYNFLANTRLFRVLCDSYGTVRAPLCYSLPSLAVKVGIYFSGNTAAQTYFLSELKQFYEEIIPALREGTDEAKLHSVIAPDLVAWGGTVYNPSNTANPFTCPSENECYINRIFACVNYYHGEEPRATLHQAEFALCFFQQANALTDPGNAANICANRVWMPDPFGQIDVCARDNTAEGIAIFLRMKDKTDNNYPHLTSFPAVTINNNRDPEAETDLLSAVCKNYQGYDYPVECQNYVTTPTPPTPPTTAAPGSTPTGPTQPPGPTTTPRPTQTVTAGSTVPPTTTVTPGSTPTGPTQPPGPTTTPRPTQTVTAGSTVPPTTTVAPGSGTTPVISVFVLLISFIISRFLF